MSAEQIASNMPQDQAQLFEVQVNAALHHGAHSIANYFVSKILLPAFGPDAKCSLSIYMLQLLIQTLGPKLQRLINIEDESTITKLDSILQNYGIGFDEFLPFTDHFTTCEIASVGVQSMMQQAERCGLLLVGLYNYDDIAFKMYLACFGKFGEPQAWWESLAGLTDEDDQSSDQRETFEQGIDLIYI
jgi:hypothetical protein